MDKRSGEHSRKRHLDDRLPIKACGRSGLGKREIPAMVLHHVWCLNIRGAQHWMGHEEGSIAARARGLALGRTCPTRLELKFLSSNPAFRSRGGQSRR